MRFYLMCRQKQMVVFLRKLKVKLSIDGNRLIFSSPVLGRNILRSGDLDTGSNRDKRITCVPGWRVKGFLLSVHYFAVKLYFQVMSDEQWADIVLQYVCTHATHTHALTSHHTSLTYTNTASHQHLHTHTLYSSTRISWLNTPELPRLVHVWSEKPFITCHRFLQAFPRPEKDFAINRLRLVQYTLFL